ncbi:MAG: TolB protein [Phycisphaerales bacterium]|jgi:TolB protein
MPHASNPTLRTPLMILAAGLPMGILTGAASAQSDSTAPPTTAQVQNAIFSSTTGRTTRPAQRPNPYLTANCTSWDTEGQFSSNGKADVNSVDTNANGSVWTTASADPSQINARPETPVASGPPANATNRGNPTNLSRTMFGDVPFSEIPGRSSNPAESFNAVQTNTTNVRRVTFADVGADFDPAMTRDGTQVVFASTQHRPTADLYIKDVSSRTVTRLTSDPAQDVMPAISPDGKYIAYCSDRDGTWDLFMMPTTGGNPVRLTNEATHDLHPTWSPDGTRIAFSRFGEVSNRWELWVMDVASPAGLQFIGYGLFPEWCPVSGTGMGGTDHIAFQRSRERGDRTFSVWTVEYSTLTGSASRETEVVSSTTEALINPSWSPDGDFLLYAAVANEFASPEDLSSPGESSLWMIGADGRGAVEFVSGPSVDLMPTWGPNNNVFFVSDRSGTENLWSVEVGTSVRTANAQRSVATMNPYANAETEPASFDDGN